MAVTRRHVRGAALLFFLLGVGALIFDLVSRNPGQMRYVLGAGFLIGLSVFTFHQARE